MSKSSNKDMEVLSNPNQIFRDKIYIFKLKNSADEINGD